MLRYVVSIDECPVTKPVGIAAVHTPFGKIGIKVFIFIKLNRDSVEPLHEHLAELAVKHKPVVAV